MEDAARAYSEVKNLLKEHVPKKLAGVVLRKSNLGQGVVPVHAVTKEERKIREN